MSSEVEWDAEYLVGKSKICVFDYIKKGDVHKSRTWWQHLRLSTSYQIELLPIPAAFEQLYKFSEVKECSLHGYLTMGRNGHLMSDIL